MDKFPSDFRPETYYQLFDENLKQEKANLRQYIYNKVTKSNDLNVTIDVACYRDVILSQILDELRELGWRCLLGQSEYFRNEETRSLKIINPLLPN